MTQQGDVTGQEPGANESGLGLGMPEPAPQEPAAAQDPPWPSPYLQVGQSVPDAYPAPPQPGQPRFGAPDGPVPMGQQPGSGPGQPGSAGFGQPGYRQPSYRQPSYGRPGMGGRPAPRARRAAARDPALAGAGERLLASLIDWILILVVASLVELSPMLRVLRQLEAIRISSQYASQSAAQSAINNLMQSPATVSALLTFWLVAFGIALAYYWVLPAIWGATAGKRAFGLRVVSASDQSRVGVKAAGIRAVLFLLGPAIFLLLPPVEVVGGLLWLADCLLLLVDSTRMQCLHDRLAGTVVIRKRWLDRQQPQPSPW